VRVIAIDGPAGSGKSTVGAAVADQTGLEVLDTGAMYRAVTLAALRSGTDLLDGTALGKLAASLRLSVGPRVLLDGEDVTHQIRSPEVGAAVSVVAAHAPVREVLVEQQRAWVEEHGGGVVEGRDIGTVVFPDAELKVYLTASPQARTHRRAGELGATGAEQLGAVAEGIAERDRLDSGRAVSPLQVAEDAHVIDSTALDLDEVVKEVLALL
jgi:cytidylate kinase